MLLDLSAAFDTIDHSIPFDFLQHWYGIDGVVLKWVPSYQDSRKQNGHLSDTFTPLVSSRLDYCNLLPYHTRRHILGDFKELKMSYVAPCAKVHKFSHVIPFLHKLHWLPIQYHILFKHNLTYKAIHCSHFQYLSSLFKWSNISHGAITSQLPQTNQTNTW